MHQLSLPGGIGRAQTPEALFAAVRADDSARALVTFYDDSTGERMELSAASLGNWVAKTHFLLTDELGLGPGDRIFVALPLHWQRLVVWLGAWSAGLEVVTRPDAAQVAFVSVERAAEAEGVQDVFALALASWGQGFAEQGFEERRFEERRFEERRFEPRRFEQPRSGQPRSEERPAGEGGLDDRSGGAAAGPPAGTQDFVVAVRPQPDAWASVRSIGGPHDPAMDGATRAELMAAARTLATEFDLGLGARVGIAETSGQAERPEAVLAALSVAGSVVLTRSPSVDDSVTERRAEQEKITHRF